MKQGLIKASKNLRIFELTVVVTCLLALLLLGPLRSLTSGLPLVAFSASVVLLAAPGALLTRWFARELFPGPALVPAALALGSGLYGLVGVPALLLHLSLSLYLVICGIILALFLAVATTVAFRPKNVSEDAGSTDSGSRWLWPPFVLIGGALVFLAGTEMPWIDGDTWNYLAWVRDYLESDRLAVHNPYFGTETGPSRILINGFFLEQAALSRLSGIDPIVLALRYLSPALTAVSLLAFYALGRKLFGSGPALVAGCLYALFMLINIDGVPPLFGREFLLRIIQDKGAARFIFMPIALCFAVGYLEGRKLRHLLLFGFMCWASVTIHPAGLAIIGLSAAGYGFLHVLANLRQWSAWRGATALGVGLLSILAVPLLYVAVTGKGISSTLYSADIGSSDPVVLANQVFVREEWQNIFVLESGSYIMHPSLILNPVMITAYVLGVPFLVWRMRTGEPAAQLLLGMLLAATVACYIPQIATFVGDNVVAPGQLHRLSWPIPLAALLTLGWALWSGVRWLVVKTGVNLRFVPPIVLLLVLATAGVAALQAVPEITRAYRFGVPPIANVPDRDGRLDPVFRWMERNITEPSVVMAPDFENLAIPAYSSNANVISFRGAPVMDNLEDLESVSGEVIEVPQGSLDMRKFYRSATPEERVEILRRYKVDYLLINRANPLSEELRGASGFSRIETPSDHYVFIAVDRDMLART